MCFPIPMLILLDICGSALIAGMLWGLRNPGDFGGLTDEEYAREEFRRQHPKRELAIYLTLFVIVSAISIPIVLSLYWRSICACP